MFRVFVSDDMAMLDGIAPAIEAAADGPVAVETGVAETPEAVIDACRETDADALVAGAQTPVTAEVVAETEPSLVSRAGVGVDTIDLDAASDAGVTVTNAPDYCTEEVASHAVALLTAAARRLGRFDRAVRDGAWGWEDTPAPRRLSEATLGCVGFGRIAREAVAMADGLVGETVVSDPYVDAETVADYGAEHVDFETVTERADLLAVFAPLTPETRALVDAAALERLPEDAVVVNVGRGAVIDDAALADALADGAVAAAGLDVLPTEPPVDSPLVGREDVLVTPHAGWYSVEAREDLFATVASAVAAVADGGRPDERVTVVDGA
ncbi:NAD(P)-dependent oxidoreductase [Halobaculum sp. MBLA0147]|uniref:NAD(P)-dependent oxidoreductase n=1 Tax=Halobaculum sp. MBLA0147 TaxID=3079934 RepID=UPI0035244AF1